MGEAVVQGMEQLLVGYAVEFGIGSAIALGELQDFFMAGVASHASFNSGHLYRLLYLA
jgi:hypothetical protein